MEQLLKDSHRLKQMRLNAFSMSRPHAARDVVTTIMHMLNNPVVPAASPEGHLCLTPPELALKAAQQAVEQAARYVVPPIRSDNKPI